MATYNDQDRDLIRITHYINPHNFWYKQETAYLYNAEDQNFQMEVNEFCETTYGRGNISSGLYTPRQKGELVAVFYVQLTRWVRAEVDDILEELNGQVHCNLWVIDEGVPIKTTCRYIKPLPERFAAVRTHVKRGGLERILPAESGYDYLQGKTVKKMTRDWCPGIVRVFESCIEEAVSLSFCNVRRHQVTEIDMFFGTMKITSHQNVTNDAIDLLKKAGGELVMIVDEAEFYDNLPILRTMDMQRFEDNDRNENMKYHTNTFRPEFSPHKIYKESKKMRSRNSYMIEQAREKVFEWDKRNIASSVVTTTDVVPEPFSDVQSQIQLKPIVETSQSLRGPNRQSSELQYTELVNETISDDEEPPKIELQIGSSIKPVRLAPVLKTDASKTPRQAPAYQRPQNRCGYDKNVADILPALNKIKLRRQPMDSNRLALHNEHDSANKSNGRTASVINLVPAGYNLGNIDLSTGSVILGAERQSKCEEAKSPTDFLNRVPKKTAQSKLRMRKNRTLHRRPHDDELDSSFEETMVQKLTINPPKVNDDDKW
ncbi:uncharacterized protein LOC129733102 [Wyeomyia smithii]|uniref:uncharacterized protein LOC129733102 n=1 Tax=Wyeomyia smithii TaxID=174621 RepID=UPI002467B2EC|nr:uncharacterized protein LOC129733102 [Wyeomyia smithii]